MSGEPRHGPGDAPPPWHGLEERALLIEQRPAPQRELAFRHGALQEVVYEGLLQAQRQPEHARAATAVAAEASQWPELASRVGWHWREAGEWEPALDWTLRAAEYAASLYAGREALDLYHQARGARGFDSEGQGKPPGQWPDWQPSPRTVVSSRWRWTATKKQRRCSTALGPRNSRSTPPGVRCSPPFGGGAPGCRR